MPLGRERALRHVEEQCRRLKVFQQRQFWPKFLYHTTDAVNAVRIVGAQRLLARSLNVGGFVDVANQGALQNFIGSHDYARLYFRPKNGYHIRVEGIKCRCDPYRQQHHVSIPCTFLFMFVNVITLPGVRFTAGNVQRVGTPILSTEAEFETLDFDSIYHDSSTTEENRFYIHDCRQAEVLVPHELPLNEHLAAIAFRTKWDMETFRALCEKEGVQVPYRLYVEQIPLSLYVHWGLYLNDIRFSEESLILRVHKPAKFAPPNGKFLVQAKQIIEGNNDRAFRGEVEFVNSSLRINGYRSIPVSRWEIELEDVLAFSGPLPTGSSEMFE